MAGRSAVAEVMDGAGPVSDVAAELHGLEAAMADPDRAGEMDAIVARYGEVQARFEELDGYALEGRAREVLSGLSFSQEVMDGDVGALRALEDARRPRPHPADAARRDAARRAEQPPRPREPDLAGQFLKGFEGGLLMTSHDWEFMEPHRQQGGGDRRRHAHQLLGQLRVLRGAARAEREAAAGPVRAPANVLAKRSSSSSGSRRAPRMPRRCRAG